MSHPITKTSVCSSESSLHQTISLDEDIPEVNFISEPESYQNDDLIKVVLETFKKEENLTLKEKLEITYFISIAIANFNEDMVREFNEEECHLAMLNWVYKYGKKLKEFRVENDIKNSIKLVKGLDAKLLTIVLYKELLIYLIYDKSPTIIERIVLAFV